MSQAKKMCFDRILPSHLRKPHRTMAYAGGRLRAIAPIGKQWPNGSNIRTRFLEGTQQQQDMVRSIADEWTHHANLTFEFTNDPTAEVRVTFDPSDGAWSYVGTDNLNIPLHAATLNLGWQDDGVILHEFGHMIGLSHEHSNPDGGIQWNEAAVIADLSGPPNFWDEATIRHNVLRKYQADQIHGTQFDEDSIMLYAFPNEWTIGDFETHENEKLSDLDQAFVASEQMYPGDRSSDDGATELEVATSVAAVISGPGEVDLFNFEVVNAGVHTIATNGVTDVVATLFGPDSRTRQIAEDDDSGAGRNALIVADLSAGTYYVQVRHFNPQQQGQYRILVSR